MIIVGVDPGLHVTGYGVLESNGRRTRVLEAGVIKTDNRHNFEGRIEEIYIEIGKVIEQFQPDYIAVEELYSHYAHPKTAIIMGHARGVVFLQAARAGIPIISYAATRIKKSLTGNGRASKLQVSRMIQMALKYKGEVSSPDTTDALAAALCHHNALLGKE